MSYLQMARLDALNAISGINSAEELKEFRDMLAHYFAEKAQKAIDKMWFEGAIDANTIEQWGNEHMRTPYRHIHKD